jgi:hypothetical protein
MMYDQAMKIRRFKKRRRAAKGGNEVYAESAQAPGEDRIIGKHQEDNVGQ